MNDIAQRIAAKIKQHEGWLPTDDESDVAAIIDAEIAPLIAMLDRLPHTADGVPVICDGMTVFCPRGHRNKLAHATGRVYCTEGNCWHDGCQGDSGSGTYYSFDRCYSVSQLGDSDAK